VLGGWLGSLGSTPVGCPEGFGDGTALRTIVGLLLSEADGPEDGVVPLWIDGVSLVILLGRREGGEFG
jgi:hypothetical protein